jgi:RND family efflux transporter MFP subunit
LVLVLLVLGACAAAGWYALAGGDSATGEPVVEPKARPVAVEVVAPRPGGLDRLCTQPGTVEPFQAADLYAKASGYLASQSLEREEKGPDGKTVAGPVLKDGKPVLVDIGTAVRAGDILARIAVPEYEKQVKQDAADVARAESKVEQSAAAVTTAEADLGAAKAAVALAGAELKSKTSYRAYREKQRERIRDLAAQKAIDQKLADEQEDQFQAAVSAELAAGEAVNAARQKEAAAASRVKQARADLKYAGSEVEVAKARLEKSRVLLEYTVIRSPYTGVVTRRSFHVGDFVKSAEAGGERVPLLAVERTDLMRVVTYVPDRDVPFVRPGNPAVVKIDALPGEPFQTAGAARVEVSRSARAEDRQTRLMRTEVDLPNPDGKLRRGMYGRVCLTLQAGSPSAVRIPSAALVGKVEGGKGTVRVVRDDVAQVVPVECGIDNGAEVEVLSGLTPADRVVIRASGTLENGTPVSITTRR